MEPTSKAEGQRKESEVVAGRRYHEQSVPILGFLGGVAFTALVLALQQRTAIEAESLPLRMDPSIYFTVLVFFLAMVSAICVMACWDAQRAVAGFITPRSASWTFEYWLHNFAFLFFLMALPIVLLPFSFPASVMVTLIGGGLGVIILSLPKEVSENPSKEQKA